jgi:hypothetical protein
MNEESNAESRKRIKAVKKEMTRLKEQRRLKRQQKRRPKSKEEAHTYG